MSESPSTVFNRGFEIISIAASCPVFLAVIGGGFTGIMAAADAQRMIMRSDASLRWYVEVAATGRTLRNDENETERNIQELTTRA